MLKLECEFKRGLGGVLAAVERLLRRGRPAAGSAAKTPPAEGRKPPETEAERAFYAAMGWEQGDWDRADWRDFTS